MGDLLSFFGDGNADETAFRGGTFKRIEDYDRLANNLQRVFHLMLDGEWHTEEDLRPVGGSRWSGRVRDLRSDAWGPMRVTAERVGGGIWRYQLDLSTVNQRIYDKIMDKNPDPVSVSDDAGDCLLRRRRENIIRAVRSAPPDVCERLEQILELHGKAETQVGDAYWNDEE